LFFCGNFISNPVRFSVAKLRGQWPSHPIADLTNAGGVDCADLNDDGEMDVVATSTSMDMVVWYEGPGPAPWPLSIIDQNLDRALFVCIEDINGDDALDVVATGYSADMVVWYEAPGWTHRTIDPNLNTANGLDIADMDDDGDLDVVAAGWTAGSEVAWYENTGAGLTWNKIFYRHTSIWLCVG
jgi:hypothetical protein